MHNEKPIIILAGIALILSACGGGGKSDSSVSSTSSNTSGNPAISSSSILSAASSNTSSSSILSSSVRSSSSISNSSSNSTSSAIKVSINIDVKHTVGNVDNFDRQKFITIHSNNTDPDWFGNNGQSLNAPNASSDLIGDVMLGYDVYFGRDTGAMAWQLSKGNASAVIQDAARLGFADEVDMNSKGSNTRWNYTTNADANSTRSRDLASRNIDNIIGAQQHPYWPDGKLIGPVGKTWSFSTTDTQTEPFGTATGHYMGHYLLEYFNRGIGDTYGQPKPKFIEVMNEPLYDLVDASPTPTTVEKVFNFHNAVAASIRNATSSKLPGANNADVAIGGYTAAFPDYDKNNFQQWLNRDKIFIDIAGNNMDFFSIHLYDFPTFNGKEQYRRGSNVEATLDLLEQYSLLKLGSVKPIVISEYGAATHALFKSPWTPQRDGLKLLSINGLLMSFLERPNTIAKTIPFIPIKAEWGRTTVAYNDRLMRQKKEATGDTGDQWVYSDLIKFYQLWSDVKGTRVDSYSNNADIVVNAYANEKDVYWILNNLETTDATLNLNTLGENGNLIDHVSTKRLYLDADKKPVLEEITAEKIPTTMTLAASGTTIIKVSYANSILINQTKTETKKYAEEYLQPITANNTITFHINGFTPGKNGEANLRLGIGRAFGKSLQPIVSVNGINIPVPQNYRGTDQNLNGKGRDNFFGVIEIPLNYSTLISDNTVTVTFPDDGGYVSSAAIRQFSFSRALSR